MIEIIAAISGIVGGLAGVITFIKFWTTRRSIQIQANEEAKSKIIENIEKNIEIQKETFLEKIRMNEEQISGLQKELIKLKEELVEAYKNLRVCIAERLDSEETAERLQSSIDIGDLCDHVLNGERCVILERYQKLLKKQR